MTATSVDYQKETFKQKNAIVILYIINNKLLSYLLNYYIIKLFKQIPFKKILLMETTKFKFWKTDHISFPKHII